jgi:uncharacterized protein YkwD
VWLAGNHQVEASPTSPPRTIAPTQARAVAHAFPDLAPADYEARVQRLINRARLSHGRRSVRFEGCTDLRAERWAARLARTSAFYHQPMEQVLDSCGATYAGEILLKGSASPREAVRLWLDSPTHRRVMLGRSARRVGIGAVVQSDGSWLVAVDFTRF